MIELLGVTFDPDTITEGEVLPSILIVSGHTWAKLEDIDLETNQWKVRSVLDHSQRRDHAEEGGQTSEEILQRARATGWRFSLDAAAGNDGYDRLRVALRFGQAGMSK